VGTLRGLKSKHAVTLTRGLVAFRVTELIGEFKKDKRRIANNAVGEEKEKTYQGGESGERAGRLDFR